MLNMRKVARHAPVVVLGQLSLSQRALADLKFNIMYVAITIKWIICI